MSPFLLIAGLLVLWQACRSFHNRYVQKCGALSFLAPIPNNSSLIGASLALQAAATDTVNGIVLSNAMTLNFGP